MKAIILFQADYETNEQRSEQGFLIDFALALLREQRRQSDHIQFYEW